jgi:hypothetical protein
MGLDTTGFKSFFMSFDIIIPMNITIDLFKCVILSGCILMGIISIYITIILTKDAIKEKDWIFLTIIISGWSMFIFIVCCLTGFITIKIV